jgi:hypothetical protein
MPLLEIKRDEPKPRLVTMGQADTIIEPPDVAESFDQVASSLKIFQENIEKAAAIPDPPLEPKKQNRGRPKKMAKEKDLSEVGTKTIREDDPGEQGAIGSHGENAPAQTKVPQSDDDKEAQANG